MHFHYVCQRSKYLADNFVDLTPVTYKGGILPGPTSSRDDHLFILPGAHRNGNPSVLSKVSNVSCSKETCLTPGSDEWLIAGLQNELVIWLCLVEAETSLKNVPVVGLAEAKCLTKKPEEIVSQIKAVEVVKIQHIWGLRPENFPNSDQICVNWLEYLLYIWHIDNVIFTGKIKRRRILAGCRNFIAFFMQYEWFQEGRNAFTSKKFSLNLRVWTHRWIQFYKSMALTKNTDSGLKKNTFMS